jgi:chemotaxis response regulator CheB
MPIKVLLADGSDLMLRQVGEFLATHPQIELVGQAASFDDAVRMAAELQPDVVVVDLGMAKRAADPLRLKAHQASLPVLAISAANVDEETLALAADIGADKLLDKMQLDSELIPIIMKLAARKPS